LKRAAREILRFAYVSIFDVAKHFTVDVPRLIMSIKALRAWVGKRFAKCPDQGQWFGNDQVDHDTCLALVNAVEAENETLRNALRHIVEEYDSYISDATAGNVGGMVSARQDMFDAIQSAKPFIEH
jgi:hypothetical protein